MKTLRQLKHGANRLTLLALTASLVETSVLAQTNLVTPAQYLASLPKPSFAANTRLPHLTRWGWTLSTNADIELANNWGYCLEFGGYATPNLVSNITKPGTLQYTIAQLVNSNPGKYKLSVLLDRTFTNPPSDFYCTNSSGWFIDSYGNQVQWASNGFSGMTLTNAGLVGMVVNATNYPSNIGWLCVCPERPQGYWQSITAYWSNSLQTIQSRAPITTVLNGGEYGLDVPGWGKAAWSKDPRVATQAVVTNAWATTNLAGMSWPRYGSNRKAVQLGLLTSAIDQLLPSRELYIFYNTGNEQNRYTAIANWFDSSDYWGWNSDVMATNTDLPSLEDYYGYGGWTSITNPFPNDILTRHLDAVGYNINLGHPLNYSWLNGGSSTNSSVTNTTQLSDIPRYYGFLKCLYTSGMVGGIAGYFAYPTGGFDAPFTTNNSPHWLLQMIALSRVHALFSQLDSYLYDGDLLPGSNQHSMSADQSAYEFTNTVGNAYDRVLVRKLRTDTRWLVTAWAADGISTNVNVTIPGLGSVQVLARDSGAVYLATTNSLTMLDANGLLPSTHVSPPSNLRVLQQGPN